MSPLIFPPRSVVLPAKMLTATVTMKATTFMPCKKAHFLTDIDVVLTWRAYKGFSTLVIRKYLHMHVPDMSCAKYDGRYNLP